MRQWSRQAAYEDRHRIAGRCARCPAVRDPGSKNLCSICLKRARVLSRNYRRNYHDDKHTRRGQRFSQLQAH